MKLGIQTSLILFFLAVILLSLPAFLYISLRITAQMIDQQVVVQLKAEADKTVDLVGLILAPIDIDLRRLSENRWLQEFLRTQDQLRNAGLSEERRAELREDSAVYLRGAEDEFNRLLNLNPEKYQRVVFVNPQGEVLAPAGLDEPPLQPSDEALLQEALDKGRGEAVVEDRVNSLGILRYAMPVIRDENVGVEDPEAESAIVGLFGTPVRKQEGVLVLDYRFSALEEKLLSTRVSGSASGAFFLLGSQADLLASLPGYKALLENYLSENPSSLQEERVEQYNWRGRSYLIYCGPARHRQGNWRLGIVAPKRDFTEYLEVASYYLITVTISLFGVALLVALVFIRRIASPLRNFVALAQQIAQGNFNVRVQPRGGQEVVELASAFNNMAGQLEIYVEEVRQKEQMDLELRIARTIQSGMLPKRVPEMPQLALEARTIPAHEVGGDYYDFLTNGPGALGLAIGDVTGRGVPAALLMTMIRSVLRSQAREGSPEQVLARLNNLIHEDIRESGHSVAMFYGVLNCEQKTFRFTNAGQVFPLWYHRRLGRCEYLEVSGLPLGIRRDIAYRVEEIRLEAGDRIVFYTDGLVESTDSTHRMFGFERFERLVVETADLAPAGAIEAILERLRRFTGREEPEDDMTLAIMDVLG